MKKFSYTLLIIVSALCSYAQRTCGTMDHHEKLIKKNPSYRLAMEAVITSFSLQRKNQSSAVVKIPVVVHVLYNSTVQNISDQQIISQIAVLNEDYRKSNSDISKVPSVFSTLAADVEIEFCLAQRDDKGNISNGITRTFTNKTSFDPDLDDAKFSANGGKDAWDSDKYLNIWVVPAIPGGTLGYAQFPGAGKATDGVVIVHKYFGTIGTAVSPFNLGRTTTHEVGHWLGLFHTFQDGCRGTSSGTCSTAGDKVCDTPPTSAENYGCPITKNSCTESPTDRVDMTMNYMDYVNDACMYMFTSGQKTRMLSFLNGTRQDILTSNGCNPVQQYSIDAGITEIVYPDVTQCSPLITPRIELKNHGTTTLTSVNILYNFNNQSQKQYNWTGSLASLGTVIIDLPKDSLPSGLNSFTAATSLPNNQSDLQASNDQITKTFEIKIPKNIPFNEGFELSNFVNTGWEILNPDRSFGWTRTTSAAKTGNASIAINNYDYAGGNGFKDELISPLIYIKSPSRLSFDVAYKLYTELTLSEVFSDTLEILVSDDCKLSYATVFKKFGLDLTTGTPYFTTDEFIPNSTEWRKYEINLDGFEGKYIFINFRNISDNENYLYLDNINVSEKSVGVEDDLENDKLLLFPNPASTSVKILSKSPLLRIKLFDVTGKLIKEVGNGLFEQDLDLSDLNGGVYLVDVITQSGKTTRKVIVDK